MQKLLLKMAWEKYFYRDAIVSPKNRARKQAEILCVVFVSYVRLSNIRHII